MIMLKHLYELLPPEIRKKKRAASLIHIASERNEIFYCAALAGESDFNICINSDMTVSCNCQDFDGSGRIGDLTTQTLEEIFSGPTAHRFRTMLAARTFPISTCINCAERKSMPASEAEAAVSSFHVPRKGIMVENTTLCNLRCHICNREQLMGLRSGALSLSLGNVEKIALLLKEHQIESLYYFNLGEPFLPTDILEQIKIIRRYNPDIRIITSTNGQLLKGNDKIEAALMMDYIIVSLDGVTQETVSRYQIGASFENGYQNMATLVAERNKHNGKTPIIEWKYVVFRWNDQPKYIVRAIELAKKANVDAIGFYRGDVRLADRSLRWHFPYFKRIGKRIRDGIVVNLNDVPEHLLSP